MPVYRKLPVEVEAIRFYGGNYHEIWEFVGTRPASWNPNEQVRNFEPIGTYLPFTEKRNSNATAELWVAANQKWLPIEDGEWILKDELGCYPCKDSKFRETYLEVDDSIEPSLPEDLRSLLNRYSCESVSGTPDHILAEYVLDCLKAFNAAVVNRGDWRGESVELPALQRLLAADMETPTPTS